MIAGGLCLQAASAEDDASYESLWTEATEKAGCTTSGYSDFVLVNCKGELILWYFTKPNHPAYPGVIKRIIVKQNGTFSAHEEGWSFGSEAEQPAFKVWFAEIQGLDRQMKEDAGKGAAVSGEAPN